MPLTVLTPFIAFVLAATSVRTRRSAANMALLGAVVTLALSVLVAWGLTRTSAPFQTTYTYLTVPVAFTGAVNFQNFTINIVIRVDRLTAVATLVVELCVIGALAWHRVMGRTEPGGARFYALVSALLFAVIGTLVSQDLAEMFAFWGLAGAATYLLLSHRWGSIEASRGGRIALVLPFVTDLSLLCGIAVLYAHYGVQTIAGLVPILHTTLGVGLKSLVAASVLIFVGIAGRLAIWPLHSWVTRTVQTSPSAASAMAQSVWSVVAIVILYRLMPIVAAANTTTLRVLVYACAVAAIAAPLLALFGNELRRTVVLAGVGTAAVGAGLVVHAYEISSTTFAVLGVACVLAAAPARAAATMAASAIAGTMRTEDLAEMGDG
ncbi:MAG TPA: proton-conducting transporter membrane subunit, partial [Candidatus Dormibacteraeota bacterium]